jgi:hypothetical protein
MSALKQIVIELTPQQRSEIKRELNKEVSHVRLWLVPGTVVLAEAFDQPESFDGPRRTSTS